MARKSLLLKTDSFGTRGSRLRKYGNKEFGYVGIILTFLALYLDYANVYARYDVIMKEASVALLFATTIATVIILDIPMYVAGCVVKELQQGLIPKKEATCIAVVAVSAFAAIATFNLWLSIECAEYLLEDPALASSTSVFEEVKATNSVIVGSIILGIQPILTSMATFVVGLYCSNPLLKTVNNIKKEINEIHSFLMQGRRAVAEIAMCDSELCIVVQKFLRIQNVLKNADPTNKEQQLYILELLEDFVNITKEAYIDSSLFAYSANTYRAAIQKVYAQEHIREQATLDALQRKLNTPDDISAISKYGVDLADKYDVQLVFGKDIAV